jgi:hypothetical protein
VFVEVQVGVLETEQSVADSLYDVVMLDDGGGDDMTVVLEAHHFPFDLTDLHWPDGS